MTIDERLEKLTERHEALTQTVELTAAMQPQDGENIRALAGVYWEQREQGLNGPLLQ